MTAALNIRKSLTPHYHAPINLPTRPDIINIEWEKQIDGDTDIYGAIIEAISTNSQYGVANALDLVEEHLCDFNNARFPESEWQTMKELKDAVHGLSGAATDITVTKALAYMRHRPVDAATPQEMVTQALAVLAVNAGCGQRGQMLCYSSEESLVR